MVKAFPSHQCEFVVGSGLFSSLQEKQHLQILIRHGQSTHMKVRQSDLTSSLNI